MKTSNIVRHSSEKPTLHRQPLAHAVAMAIAIFSGHALAQTVNFPPVPLTVATAVPSNLLYIHDDSNSMYWSYIPDAIHRTTLGTYSSSRAPAIFYMSPDFNKAYYNPAFKYPPPPAPQGVTITDIDGKVVTDGTLGNAKFTNAWFNGYDIATRNQSGFYYNRAPEVVRRSVDLSTSYVPTDWWSALYGSATYGTKINGTLGAPAEFLYDTPAISLGKPYYYLCKPGAWKNFPVLTVAGNFDKTQCTGYTLNTAEEKQNFANWYAYYRTRNYASKAGVGRAFTQLDSSVRVGWGLINKKNAVTVDGKSVNTIMQGVRVFEPTRKKDFLDWLYKIQPAAMNNSPVFISQLPASQSDGGATPLRRALDAAGQYYDRSTGSNLGPWADDPARPGAAKDEKAAACRKSFTILMTDGYWNGATATNASIANKNVDGSAPGSPFKDSFSNTMADIAWYYWDKKLVPSGIADKVPPTIVPGTLGSVPPKYRDPSTQPHMTTFIISFGVTGTVDKEKAFTAIHDSSVGIINWLNNPNSTNTQISEPAKLEDLLHAGVNGHGDFFSAANPDEFVEGMASIVNAVNSAQKASSGNVDASDASQVTGGGNDALLFRTSFKPDDWSGEVIAQKLNSSTGLMNEVWHASAEMPFPSDRRIFTSSSNSGVPFIWGNLGSANQDALKNSSPELDAAKATEYAKKVVDYVRGSIANEGMETGKFRSRHRAVSSRAPLADSPHNTPLFIKYGSDKPSMIFLGANDGMLHAFNATSGREEFAYIPSALIPRLSELTNGHSFYVDGELMVTTPAQTPGKYLLVGALGRGGKGLYGLDVSDPSIFQSSNVEWELNGSPTCLNLDLTSAWLGNITGALPYALVDGKNPSAIFGNGYNSCNDKAALGIVNVVNGNATIIKASDETANGLAAPSIHENTLQVVSAYAGDLRGKMWKFGLNPLLGTSSKLFDTGTTNQPITARALAATLETDPGVKKTFVFFGTGRYLSVSDKATLAQQRMYALIDETGATIPISDLQARGFKSMSNANGVPVKTIFALPGNVNMGIKKGWYLSLAAEKDGNQSNPDAGERVVSTPILVKTSSEDILVFSTIIPPGGGDPCSPKGSGWLYAINAKTGSAPTSVFLDINRDGVLDEKDMIGGEVPAGLKVGDILDGMPGQPKEVNGHIVICGMESDKCLDLKIENDPPPNVKGGRISWREIIN